MTFEEVLRHFNNGFNQTEIAKIAGVSRQRIYQMQKKMGLPLIGQQKRKSWKKCERVDCQNKISNCKSKSKRRFCSMFCWTYKTEEQKIKIQNSFIQKNRKRARINYWAKRGMLPPEIPIGRKRVVIFRREKSSTNVQNLESRWTKNCYKCKKPTLTHSKCQKCEKLIHFMEDCC